MLLQNNSPSEVREIYIFLIVYCSGCEQNHRVTDMQVLDKYLMKQKHPIIYFMLKLACEMMF